MDPAVSRAVLVGWRKGHGFSPGRKVPRLAGPARFASLPTRRVCDRESKGRFRCLASTGPGETRGGEEHRSSPALPTNRMEFLSEEERWASFVSSKHRRLVEHLQSTGVLTSPRCMAAVGCTDRGKFVLQGGAAAYGDHPHPIGFGATISAPHMHAYCLELLHDQLVEGSRALDVGSGSSYITACMGAMVAPSGYVYGVEHIPELVAASRRSIAAAANEGNGLAQMVASQHLSIICDDGRGGLPDKAPFDAIHVGASAETVPQVLVDQLRPGGRLVVPVGGDLWSQALTVVDKHEDGTITTREAMSVRYVPLCSVGRQVSRELQEDEGW